MFSYEEVALEVSLRITDTPCICRMRLYANDETKREGHVALQATPINMTFARKDRRKLDSPYTDTNWNRVLPHNTGNECDKRRRERRSRN